MGIQRRPGGVDGMVDLSIDVTDLDRLARELDIIQKDADKALKRATGRMAKWLRTQSIRGLSSALDVQQKVLRRRLKQFRVTTVNGQGVKVWYGLNPIGFIYLGVPRKSGHGVRVGKHYVDGGFVATMKNGAKQVFKRTSGKRLPIVVEGLDIQKKAETYIEDDLMGGEFDAQFLKFFEHELRWQSSQRT